MNDELLCKIIVDTAELVDMTAIIRKQYAAMQARVAELEGKLRWIPVSERLPESKVDRLYMCWVDFGIQLPLWGVFMWFADAKSFLNDGVTHWMDWEPEATEVNE